MIDYPAETVNARLLEQANQMAAVLEHPENQGKNPLFSPTFPPEEQIAIARESIRLVHRAND